MELGGNHFKGSLRLTVIVHGQNVAQGLVKNLLKRLVSSSYLSSPSEHLTPELTLPTVSGIYLFLLHIVAGIAQHGHTCTT